MSALAALEPLGLTRIALVALGLILASTVYTAHFSPLGRQKIPGPWHARYSRGWLLGKVLAGTRCFGAEDMHQFVSIRFKPTLDLIYNDKRFAKSRAYEGLVFGGADHAMTHLADEHHRPKRKVVSQALTQANINRFEPELRANAAELVSRIRREGQDGRKSVNWLMLARYFALDTLGLVALGQRFNIIAGDGGHFISDCIDAVPIAQAPRILMPKLLAKMIVSLPIPLMKHSVASENRIVDYAGERYMATRDELKGIKTQDLPRETAVQRLVHSPYGPAGEPIPFAEARAELSGLIFAGSDTVSNTISFLFYNLALMPDVLDKVYTELKTAFDDPLAIPTASQLDELPYFRGVIQEGLRLYGGAPPHLERVVPEGGLDCLGFHIPEGTIVAGQAWSMHRQPSVFPQPDEFNPERWLEPTTQMREAMMPFGAGLRICYGRFLAQLELKLMAAAVLRNFSIRIPPETTDKTMQIEERFTIAPVSHRCDLIFVPRA